MTTTKTEVTNEQLIKEHFDNITAQDLADWLCGTVETNIPSFSEDDGCIEDLLSDELGRELAKKLVASALYKEAWKLVPEELMLMQEQEVLVIATRLGYSDSGKMIYAINNGDVPYGGEYNINRQPEITEEDFDILWGELEKELVCFHYAFSEKFIDDHGVYWPAIVRNSTELSEEFIKNNLDDIMNGYSDENQHNNTTDGKKECWEDILEYQLSFSMSFWDKHKKDIKEVFGEEMDCWGTMDYSIAAEFWLRIKKK